MKARDELEDLMVGTYGMPDEKAGRMLDAFAHELAEKVRRSVGVMGQSLAAAEVSYFVRKAADLIDPEVKS